MGATAGTRRAAVRQLTAPCSSLCLAAQAHTQAYNIDGAHNIDAETHCTAGLTGTGYKVVREYLRIARGIRYQVGRRAAGGRRWYCNVALY